MNRPTGRPTLFSSAAVRRMMFRRTLSVMFIVVVVAVGLQVWRSTTSSPLAERHCDLWGERGERWKPDGRLPDVSFAGYGLGQRPIPHPPVAANVRDFGADGSDDQDDTEAVLAAVANTEQGAVLLPEGRYILTSVIRLDRPNLVLRGEGPSRTTLYFPKALGEVLGTADAIYGDDGRWSWGGGFLWLAGSDEGTRLAEVVKPARRGDTRLQLSSTAGLAPGQLVRLVQHATEDGSLLEHLHGRPTEPAPALVEWVNGRLVDFVSPIARIEDDVIELERPLRVDVRLAWRPEIFSHQPTLTEVGIEELSLEFPPTTYPGHFREEGYNGIYLAGAHQFWISNVEILEADCGVVSAGISRFGTITRLRLANDRRPGLITGHHGISLEGPQDILVTGFHIETRFLHDITVDGLACGNVFSKGRGVDLCFDHHTGAPYENVFTDLDLGAGTRVWDSGGPATGWGEHAAARETFWNVRSLGPALPVPDYPQLTLVGLSGITTSPHADHWVADHDPTLLLPQDLHRAQVQRRLDARR